MKKRMSSASNRSVKLVRKKKAERSLDEFDILYSRHIGSSSNTRFSGEDDQLAHYCLSLSLSFRSFIPGHDADDHRFLCGNRSVHCQFGSLSILQPTSTTTESVVLQCHTLLSPTLDFYLVRQFKPLAYHQQVSIEPSGERKNSDYQEFLFVARSEDVSSTTARPTTAAAAARTDAVVIDHVIIIAIQFINHGTSLSTRFAHLRSSMGWNPSSTVRPSCER